MMPHLMGIPSLDTYPFEEILMVDGQIQIVQGNPSVFYINCVPTPFYSDPQLPQEMESAKISEVYCLHSCSRISRDLNPRVQTYPRVQT